VLANVSGAIRFKMRVIARRALREFWERHPDAENPLLAWFREVERERWTKPADVKAKYGKASFVGDRVVFNIKGNDYRLIVRIDYPHQIVFVRFVGTHKDYDALDDVAEV
jgi:mRNA interferase HigB